MQKKNPEMRIMFLKRPPHENIEVMTIMHIETNYAKINILEEISSRNIVNDVINGRNDPMYRLLLSASACNSKDDQPFK